MNGYGGPLFAATLVVVGLTTARVVLIASGHAVPGDLTAAFAASIALCLSLLAVGLRNR